jgi:PPOX class probable F420-dependent enzyme
MGNERKAVHMAQIPDRGREILEKRSIGHIATLMKDGAPQVTPVWVDVDGDDILVNTLKGRLKDRNLRRDPRVAISVPDPETPTVALIVRGTAELVEEGAREHTDELAKKYLDEDTYPWHQPDEVRTLIRIHPERVLVYGA